MQKQRRRPTQTFPLVSSLNRVGDLRRAKKETIALQPFCLRKISQVPVRSMGLRPLSESDACGRQGSSVWNFIPEDLWNDSLFLHQYETEINF